jgi:RsiW-degrading membrane proteinase PrsW (M82 family)
MRLQDKVLGFVVNFLLGAAWAMVLIGAISSFLSFFHESIFVAIVSALIGALPGLVSVLIIEHIITNKEKQQELEKQTKILEQLLHHVTKKEPSDTEN